MSRTKKTSGKKTSANTPRGITGLDPIYGSLTEVGKRYGFSSDTLTVLIERGDLIAYRLGGTGNRRVKYADVENLLIAEEVEAS